MRHFATYYTLDLYNPDLTFTRNWRFPTERQAYAYFRALRRTLPGMRYTIARVTPRIGDTPNRTILGHYTSDSDLPLEVIERNTLRGSDI